MKNGCVWWKFGWLALVAVAFAAVQTCVSAADGSGELKLASDGRLQFSIAVSDKASQTDRFAAEELQHYLESITGAKLTITGKIARPYILVATRGAVPAGVSLPPSAAGLAAEGYMITVRDGNVLLVGADSRGTLYAVYDFLERLGCRWLAPNFDFYKGTSEVIPQRTTLTFALDNDVVEQPVLPIRKIYVEEGRSHTTQNLLQMIDWMPKRRFNTLVVPLNYAGGGRVKWDNWRAELSGPLQRRGILIEVGGHGYENYLNADMEGGNLFVEHPEWFGMNEKGERVKDAYRVFCTSNPEARSYFTTNVVRYLDVHPEIQIFDFWPPDGAKWCSCSNCLALGTPSDRQALLLSEVMRAVHKSRPGLRFETVAYAACVAPPEKVTMDPAVLVDFCPINQCFEMQIQDPASEKNAAYVAQLRNWLRTFKGDISIYSYYRKYAWRSLPTLLPHYMQSDLQFYQQIGVKGVSTYAEPGDWGTYELNHYVLSALAWNPEVNVDALVRQFAETRFGTNAPLALEAYGLLERDVRHFGSLPGTELKTAPLYDAAIKSFSEEIKKVTQAATNADDSAQGNALRRLALVMEYAKRDFALQKAKAEKVGDVQRETMKAELTEFLETNAAEGVFVVKKTARKQPAPAAGNKR